MELSKDDVLAEISRLNLENAELRRENDDLQLMLEMHTEHSDIVEEDLLDKVESTLRDSEKRFRMITETIPVPIIISRVVDGTIVYVNEHAAPLLGLHPDSLLNRRITDFYQSADQKALIDTLSAQGHVENYELQGKKSDGKPFWVALFIQSLSFNDEPCLLSALYDLTERRQAEEEIRRLSEELERRVKAREGKYLTFSLGDEDYGISIIKVREIIGIKPVTSVPQSPDYVKGVINLRGRVFPVMDLRLRLGLEPVDYTDRTCIIVVEIEKRDKEKSKFQVGVVVDFVSEVLNIRGQDVEDAPNLGMGENTEYILGMARIDGEVKVLINIDNVLSSDEIDMLDDKL